MIMKRNVVVTGIGVVSSIGIGREKYWEGLLQGKTGLKPISLFDTSKFNVNVAGEISDFDPLLFLGKKGLRTLDRSTRMISSAAGLSINDARLQITDENARFIGVSIGTTFGSLKSISQFDRSGLTDGPKFVNPSFFPNTVINSPASQVSIRFRIKGFNATISTGFCSSLDAVLYASDFIRMKRADAVFAGGVEELCEETFLFLHTLGYLSGIDGSVPVCCPFDIRRNGIIFSEGAAVLVLEDEKAALLRDAEVFARVLGYGNGFDPTADGYFNGNGNGLKNAIKCAFNDSHVKPEDISCVFSSANSNEKLDVMETNVIKDVFGEYAWRIPVTAIKSMIGEPLSASGALICTAAVESLYHGIIPPTVNYKEKDPDCDLDYVIDVPREKDIRNALVISSDPYGNNSAIVLGKYSKDEG